MLFLGFPEDGFDSFNSSLRFARLEKLGLVEAFYAGVSVAELSCEDIKVNKFISNVIISQDLDSQINPLFTFKLLQY